MPCSYVYKLLLLKSMIYNSYNVKSCIVSKSRYFIYLIVNCKRRHDEKISTPSRATVFHCEISSKH